MRVFVPFSEAMLDEAPDVRELVPYHCDLDCYHALQPDPGKAEDDKDNPQEG